MPDIIPNTWRNAKGEEIPLDKMSDEDIQKAYNFSEARTLQHYAKVEVFTSLMDMLEAEAAKRNITLQTIDETTQAGNYLSTRRIWKDTLSIGKNPA
jgi:DTW domain-containing protein YfiP